MTPLGGAGPNSNRFTRLLGDINKKNTIKKNKSIKLDSVADVFCFSVHLSYRGGGLMLVPWTPDSEPLSKAVGLPGPTESAGLLTEVSHTKSRQEASLDSRF